MGLLTDKQLREEIHSKKGNILTGLADDRLNAAIRGCAIDLHIGGVFLPGKGKEEPGSATEPLRLCVSLKEGETAVIKTAESFKLDDRHAAFVFPASSVSIEGLLMTNPGHVDPGYVGPVHVTVINMGRAPFALQPGARLLRCLIYRLDDTVDSPKTAGAVASPVTNELLQKLSPDFLSVNERTAQAAKREIDASVKRSQWMQFVVPALATLLGVVVSTISSTSRFDERIKSLEEAKALERLQKLESSYPTEKRLFELEAQLKAMREEAAKSRPARPTKP